MLCEINTSSNFLVTWAAMTLIGASVIVFASGIVFRLYYWKPTYERWQK